MQQNIAEVARDIVFMDVYVYSRRIHTMRIKEEMRNTKESAPMAAITVVERKQEPVSILKMY